MGDHYEVSGVQVPRVSAILRPASSGLEFVDPDLLERKRQLGTAVHQAILLHVQNDLRVDSLDPDVVPYFMASLAYMKDSGFEPIEAERFVHHKTFGYAGTLDIYGRVTRTYAVADWKCVATVMPATALQTAAYMEGLRFEGKPVERRFAVRLKPDGTYTVVPYSSPMDFQTFLAFLSTHKWRTRNGIG